MHVDLFTRQTYNYATPKPCNTKPRIIEELDPVSDYQDFYILRSEPIFSFVISFSTKDYNTT